MCIILAFVQTTNPRATTDDKLVRPLDGLSTHSKRLSFRTNPPPSTSFRNVWKTFDESNFTNNFALIQEVAFGLALPSTTILLASAASPSKLSRGSVSSNFANSPDAEPKRRKQRRCGILKRIAAAEVSQVAMLEQSSARVLLRKKPAYSVIDSGYVISFVAGHFVIQIN